MYFVKAKNILSAKNGMNLYRGCTHGCIYCDSRSKCYGFTHEFEDVEVKENAPELLERSLRSKRKRCMISTGSMCDPYMDCEEKLQLTRRCLEIIDNYEFGVVVLTKSARILRDLDLLKSINKKSKCIVQMTLTTYDEELCRIIEPNVSTTKERLNTLEILRDNGIPTIVWLSPVLPYINDTRGNIEGIMDYCIRANVRGIVCFGMGLTLREGNREYFFSALDKHFPGLKEKYISRYGNSYELVSDRSRELMDIFRKKCASHGIMYNTDECFRYINEFPDPYEQLSLFLNN